MSMSMSYVCLRCQLGSSNARTSRSVPLLRGAARKELGSRRAIQSLTTQARAQLLHRSRAVPSACSESAPRYLAGSRYLSSTPSRHDNQPDKATIPSQDEPIKPQTTTQVIAQRVKDRLSSLSGPSAREDIYNVPNILTFSRLIAAPVVGYLVLHDQHAWAVALFAYAGITDLVDGWIARKYKLQTVVGSVIDPMADKLLMTVLVGCLAVKGALPLWLATVIFGRDMSLGFAAIYYRYASLPPPKTFTRYWDFSLPSAEVHPTQMSKYNTFLQLILIGATTTLPLLTAPSGILSASTLGLTVESVEQAVKCMQYLVASTTIWSGASYVWRKDVVKILGSDEELKRKQGVRGRAIIGVSSAAFAGLALWLAQKEEAPEGRLVNGGV